MHSEDRTFFGLAGEKLFTSHCTCYNIANEWISFRQISRKVHLFPFIALFNAEAGETKVTTDCVGADEVDLSICRLNVDIFRMLFLRKLFKAKRSAVLIYMSQHMCILVSTQPFIFPIKPERFTRGHQLFDHLVILHSASIEILH